MSNMKLSELSQCRRPTFKPSTRYFADGIGVIASALLHLLVVGTLVFGGINRQVRVPDRTGAGASALVSASEPVMTLILINDPGARTTTAEPLLELASRGVKPLRPPDPEEITIPRYFDYSWGDYDHGSYGYW